MADANTIKYGFVKPEVGASADSWGTKLNGDFDDLDALLGVFTTTGSADAYVLTTGLSLNTVPAAYATGMLFWIKANFTNGGAATINVDTLGAKALTKNGSVALAAGDITSGQVYVIAYDGTRFQVVAGLGAIYQPIDPTLTALAALAWASGSPVIQFTAADTVSLTLTPSLTTLTLSGQLAGSAGTAAAPGVTTGGLDYGMYKSATSLAFATAGALRFFCNSSSVQCQVPVYGSAGSASAPSVCPSSADTNSGFYAISSSDNVGLALNGALAVDFSTARVLLSSGIDLQIDTATGPGSVTSVGFRGSPINTQDATYGLVLADAGKTIYHTSASTHTWTIPANASVAYPIGTMIAFENESGGGNVTIAITTDTLRWGSATGSRTLGANGSAVAKKVTATSWRLTGMGLS